MGDNKKRRPCSTAICGHKDTEMIPVLTMSDSFHSRSESYFRVHVPLQLRDSRWRAGYMRVHGIYTPPAEKNTSSDEVQTKYVT